MTPGRGGAASPQPPGSPPLHSRGVGATPPSMPPPQPTPAAQECADDGTRHAVLEHAAALAALTRRLESRVGSGNKVIRRDLRSAEEALTRAARAWAASSTAPEPLPRHLRAVMRLAGRAQHDSPTPPPAQRAAKARRRDSAKQQPSRHAAAVAEESPEERGGHKRRRQRGHGYLDAAGTINLRLLAFVFPTSLFVPLQRRLETTATTWRTS